MHDAKGRPLAEGDRVVLAATVKNLNATDDYCNVTIESVRGRRPDGAKECVYAINTGVLLRANEGDDNADTFPAEAPADDEIVEHVLEQAAAQSTEAEKPPVEAPAAQ